MSQADQTDETVDQTDETVEICLYCKVAPAVACDECRRALALFAEYPMPTLQERRRGLPVPFDCITRHPESGTSCKLCMRGTSALCGWCLLTQALEWRNEIQGPHPQQPKGTVVELRGEALDRARELGLIPPIEEG